jgi:replication-associated recombination protein RarA
MAIETEAPPLQIVTAAQLDITPEMLPWLNRYRRYGLTVLARAMAISRCRDLAPCLSIYGPPGSGKSLLATALVRECEAVWCLDCVANAYRLRTNLRLSSVVLEHCAVFVIDEIDLLSGAELQRFYHRCSASGTVLVLMSQTKETPQNIGFPLPAGTTVFRLSREAGLVPVRSPFSAP